MKFPKIRWLCTMYRILPMFFDPLFSVNLVVSQDEVLILDVKEVSGDSSFHEVLSAYDVLVFS